jgi:uncharacterized membrane protein
MKSDLTQEPIDQNVEYSSRSRIFRGVFILLGSVLVFLSVLLPILMETVTEHRVIGATFASSYLRSLTPFITNASLASSFVAIAVILSFEKARANLASVLFGALTLSVFATEISLSLYLSLMRPTTGSTLFEIYMLMGLIPFGLACTMFTLASIMSPR